MFLQTNNYDKAKKWYSAVFFTDQIRSGYGLGFGPHLHRGKEVSILAPKKACGVHKKENNKSSTATRRS